MKTCPTCQASYPNNFAVCPQDGTALVEQGTWAEGTVVRGKYRIVDKVGQGGMGSVYKALHLAFDEVRALKVMSPELMRDELFVKRFKHEAVITRKLQHPNAVRVDDIDEAEDGRPFIVMEFIEGKSLKKLIQDEGSLPAPRICAIIRQVAAALDAAHQLGMIHRDIKPENIVLIETPEGEQAKVLDFGIAKVKEARLGGGGLTLTGTGVVIGTPQYMSPEQAMGKRGDELDGRSDIYSVGIVMYQMLTGELPFKAETTMEMLLAHMQRPPTPIRTLHPELQIPEALANLVMRCLEKKRDLRPATAKVLVEELDRVEKKVGPVGTTRPMRETVKIAPEELEPPPPAPPPPRPPVMEPRPEPPKVEHVAPPVVTPRPAPRPSPPPVAVQPRESHWGLWVAIVVLVVGLGGGGWYLSHRPSPVVPETVTPPQKSSVKTDVTTNRGTTPGLQQIENTGKQSEPTKETKEPERQGEGQRQGGTTVQEPGEKPLETVQRTPPETGGQGREKVPVDPVKIAAAIKLGDFFVNRGEYDNAIRAYQDGLRLDPGNTTLRAKLNNARRAKAAEQRILQ